MSLSASLAAPCGIWALWLDFWEQSKNYQAWQWPEAFVADWPGGEKGQEEVTGMRWQQRPYTAMPMGQKRTGRLCVPTLGTWEWGSQRTRGLRPSRNGSPVLPNLVTIYFPENQEVGF